MRAALSFVVVVVAGTKGWAGPTPSDSTLTMYMSPLRTASNAMNRPSGDHVGPPNLSGRLSVILATLDPSASMTNTAGLPSRFDWNAILVPSGDHAGLWSTALLRVTLWTFEPSASMT